MFDRNFSLSATSSGIALAAGQRHGVDDGPERTGPGTIAVSPGPISARHMWLKPSFEPRQTIISLSGSSRTP